MNQKQLAGRIAKSLGMKKTVVDRVVESMLSEIAAALSKSEKVRLVGFGNFLVRSRAARVGRNPQTGEKISIPVSKAPAFVPGINLKKTVKSK
jgi:DNA-binding protein HU-beta